MEGKKMENKGRLFYTVLLSAIVLLVNLKCKQPYIPPASSTASNYLVVNGTINTWGDTCTINLSRTVKLTDTINSVPELNAIVTVQDNDGSSYPLAATTNGNYVYPNFSFLSTSTKLYRLNIVTSVGETYQSDFVPIKNSPPIDSIYYQATSSGIQVYSNTHDPANKTRYYRWDYNETWIIHSYFESFYEVQTTPKDTVVERSYADQIDSCWINGNSSTIILNSSAKLSQDVIMNNPVAFVNSSSEKLSHEYSVLLHQYALTEDAFNYWQNLKLNTEQLGSIFDAQPSQIQGNIHCISNPAEPVIGYISAGSDARKRIFIRRGSLSNLPPIQYMTGCTLDTLYVQDLPNLFRSEAIPIGGIFNPGAVIIGYTFSVSRPCVDCTLRGTNKQPSYWVY